jgi:hypothetical protein
MTEQAATPNFGAKRDPLNAPDFYDRADCPPDQLKSRTAFLKSIRFVQLSRLAGVYRADHFPFVAGLIERQPGLAQTATVHYDAGKQMRIEKGISVAEKHCAVTPYRLWMAE